MNFPETFSGSIGAWKYRGMGERVPRRSERYEAALVSNANKYGTLHRFSASCHTNSAGSQTSPTPNTHTTSLDALDIFISAGDASGDAHGADLMTHLRSLVPSLRVRGIGGKLLREAGAECVFDSSGWSVIGPVEAARLIPSLWLKFQRVKRLLCTDPPDVVVPVDFGGFNVRLARFAIRQGIPVLYYFPPRSWAREGKIGLGIAQVATRIATPFRWSEERLQSVGAKATFVGHPVLDRARASADVAELRREFEIPSGGRVVSIFPGSRVPEIRDILPVVLSACDRIRNEKPETVFLLSRAPNLGETLVTKAVRGFDANPRIIAGRVYDLMAVADVGITVSGTVTLEAACMGMPMVIVYTGPWLGRKLWRIFMNLPTVGMPNLLLGEMVAPELICEQLTPEALSQQVMQLLNDDSKRDHQRRSLLGVRDLLGPAGASRRTAEMIVDMVQNG